MQTVRVPSRYSKPMKVKVAETREGSLFLFEPDPAFLEGTGLMVEDSISSQGKEATLVVSNPNSYQVALEGGRQSGGVQAASWTCDQGSEDPEDHGHERGSVQSILVSPASNSKERVQQLMQNIDKHQLDPPIRAQFETLLQEFHDAFALSNQELRCTDIVTHSIDTGGGKPNQATAQSHPFCITFEGGGDGYWNVGPWSDTTFTKPMG